MRKNLLSIVAATIMALTLAGCNDGGSSAAANGTETASLLETTGASGSVVNLATLSTADYLALFDSPVPTGLDLTGNEVKLTPDTPPKNVAAATLSASYIWIANSDEGTISKLDTATGQELGRYRTGPSGSVNGNPSRTTVDKFGNVWVGNRNNNTVTKVGLKENNQCIDRNANGVIDTSTGGTDVKTWTGTFGAPVGSTVEDECILLHVALSAEGVTTPNDIRTVAIDPDNNVFVGAAYSGTGIFKINGSTGATIAAKNTLQGHYGGVVDKNGNLWSIMSGAGKVQKTSKDLQTSVLYDIGHSGYGIAIDKYGKVWTTEYGQRFSTFDPTDPVGTLKVFTQTASFNAQGITTNKDGDIFIAGSLSGNTVGHYKQVFDNAGAFTGVSFVANYTVGRAPTGVAVDANGSVWATNQGSNSASRITLNADPALAVIATFPVGLGPYNYSDMTGSVFTLVTAKPFGYWEPLVDSKRAGFKWKKVYWQLKYALKEGAVVKFSVKASDDKLALNGMEYVEINNDTDLTNIVGRYLRLKIYLEANQRPDSPIITKILLY
jgi:streptogramin lyase